MRENQNEGKNQTTPAQVRTPPQRPVAHTVTGPFICYSHMKTHAREKKPTQHRSSPYLHVKLQWADVCSMSNKRRCEVLFPLQNHHKHDCSYCCQHSSAFRSHSYRPVQTWAKTTASCCTSQTAAYLQPWEMKTETQGRPQTHDSWRFERTQRRTPWSCSTSLLRGLQTYTGLGSSPSTSSPPFIPFRLCLLLSRSCLAELHAARSPCYKCRLWN